MIAAGSAPAGPAKILVVDDRLENRIALEALLQAADVQVLAASSGVDALELLLAHDFALALIDVEMPGMDGFELADLMRGVERTKRVPIIFVTAGARDGQRVFQGYESGAVDFLVKPLDPHALQRKAAIFLELHRRGWQLAAQFDELRESERRQREAMEAAEQANRAKDEFLAVLGHELRNPLAPIVTSLHLVRLKSGGELPRELQVVERQVSHMMRLVDDLLDVNRITQGKVELRHCAIELAEVVARAVETVSPLLDQHRHRLTLDVPANGLAVSADPLRLTQVVANLLSNAARYTEPAGHIHVEAQHGAAQVVLHVRDTGIGIAPETLSRIFEPFVQEPQARDRARGGLGLGLAIARSLATLHGGELSAHSDGLGKGSVFTLRLPAVSVTAACTGEIRQPTAAPAAPGHRVLVVDDNEDAALTLAEALERLGHQTHTAHDGPSALLAAERFAPQCAVLDLGLPVMDGFELARLLRERANGSRIGLVALTGYGRDTDRRRCESAGFDAHLAKPADIGQIDTLLRRIAPGSAGPGAA